jgi:hypothetical protein
MNSQAIFIERRKHSREGIMGELENITYSVLRQYDSTSQSSANAVIAEPITQ